MDGPIPLGPSRQPPPVFSPAVLPLRTTFWYYFCHPLPEPAGSGTGGSAPGGWGLGYGHSFFKKS